MSTPVGIFVCEHHYKELCTVISSGGYDDVTVISLPVICYDNSIDISETVRIISEKSVEFSHSIFIGAYCHQRIKRIIEELKNTTVTTLDQCFTLYIGTETLSFYQNQGYFVMTPGWAASWRTVLDRWQFNRQYAMDFFNDSCTKLLLLDTGVDSNIRASMQEFSEYINIPFDIIPVGLEKFDLHIIQQVSEFRMENERAQLRKSLSEEIQRVVQYTMVFDLINMLTSVIDETKAIEEIMYLFSELFSPEIVKYVSISNNQNNRTYIMQNRTFSINENVIVEPPVDDYHISDDGKSFILTLSYHGTKTGFIKVENVLMPEFIEQYLNTSLVLSQIVGIVIDNARNYQQIQSALNVKEILMKELQHRVKNNMQLLISLISLQMNNISDNALKSILTDLKNRITVISEIHNTLYLSDNISTIDLSEFIRSLTNKLVNIYDNASTKIELQLKTESVIIGISKAIHCGLIVNEILTNALKYAFPPNHKAKGIISISVHTVDNYIHLIISDNGAGIPEHFDLFETNSLGLRIIPLMVKQLGGEIKLDRSAGTKYAIKFMI